MGLFADIIRDSRPRTPRAPVLETETRLPGLPDAVWPETTSAEPATSAQPLLTAVPAGREVTAPAQPTPATGSAGPVPVTERIIAPTPIALPESTPVDRQAVAESPITPAVSEQVYDEKEARPPQQLEAESPEIDLPRSVPARGQEQEPAGDTFEEKQATDRIEPGDQGVISQQEPTEPGASPRAIGTASPTMPATSSPPAQTHITPVPVSEPAAPPHGKAAQPLGKPLETATTSEPLEENIRPAPRQEQRREDQAVPFEEVLRDDGRAPDAEHRTLPPTVSPPARPLPRPVDQSPSRDMRPTEPTVHIGQIDVVVLSPQPKQGPTAANRPDPGFTSRHYLRFL